VIRFIQVYFQYPYMKNGEKEIKNGEKEIKNGEKEIKNGEK
jgi:hypothetical protein